MKKIGLAVCFDTKNFGSQLQVLATIKKVEELGCIPEIIEYNKKLTLSFVIQQIPRLFNVSFFKSKIKGSIKKSKVASDKEISSNVDIRNHRFMQFREKYFKSISYKYIGWKNLKIGASKRYDAVLCGSDQLWLPSNLESHFYTLEFAPKCMRKIAYATSFGVSCIPWYQRRRTAKYLNNFDYLSTRELKGKEIIHDLVKKNAKVVCDPTLLFPAEQWDNILAREEVIAEKYIFCYFLGENKEHRNVANELKSKTGYKIVTIPFLDNYVESDKVFGDIQLYDVDSKDFVNLIRNAEFILTDSFHGTVFSILNHKKFITFDRFASGKGSRNSRIDSLCSLLDLNTRRFNSNIWDEVNHDIDYIEVDKRLEKLRCKSELFLSTALK